METTFCPERPKLERYLVLDKDGNNSDGVPYLELRHAKRTLEVCQEKLSEYKCRIVKFVENELDEVNGQFVRYILINKDNSNYDNVSYLSAEAKIVSVHYLNDKLKNISINITMIKFISI